MLPSTAGLQNNRWCTIPVVDDAVFKGGGHNHHSSGPGGLSDKSTLAIVDI
jgi:hypothetical protein